MKYSSIFIRVALLALGQSLDCHSASEVSLLEKKPCAYFLGYTVHASNARTSNYIPQKLYPGPCLDPIPRHCGREYCMKAPLVDGDRVVYIKVRCWYNEHQHIGLRTKWLTKCRQHFECIFMRENYDILIRISGHFVPKGSINNMSALLQAVAWPQIIEMPSLEPM